MAQRQRHLRRIAAGDARRGAASGACGLVEALIATADADGILQFGQQLKVGSSVRLMAGPFADQLAILDHLDDSGRVRVLLDILGRKVSISTGSNNLLPLTETRR
jgi:transcription termination/antitermination protein NusG